MQFGNNKQVHSCHAEMELLKHYNSSSSDTDGELGSRQVRQVYLITYSQANTTKFPTRRSFAEAVVRSFSQRTARVVQWCCARENHQGSGVHYHVAIKLNKNQRWLPAKNFLKGTYGISVHFSNVHANYFTAWRYVTKEDTEYEQSETHPDLSNACEPTTMKALKTLRRQRKIRVRSQSPTPVKSSAESEDVSTPSNAEKPIEGRARKRRRLSSYEVSQIIVAKNLRDRTALMAFANVQKQEGKTDLAEFIVNRGTKVVNELISNAWDMENAEETMRRREKSRMVILQEAYDGECTCQTHREWETCALEILHNNDIPPQQFGAYVKDSLMRGRGKYRNVMLTGPANCGKTFLLNPLNKVYHTFTNPASTSFAWVGAENAEIIFLNDFRWSPQIIAWHDLLLLLEGQQVNLPAPKSHFAKDVTFKGDTPIFCTTKRPICFVKNGCVDDRETEMMSVRWKVFNLTYQIPQAEQRQVEPCSSCFAQVIFHAED